MKYVAVAALLLAGGCTTVHEAPSTVVAPQDSGVRYHVRSRPAISRHTSEQIITFCDQLRFSRGSEGYTNCMLRGIDRYAVDPGIEAQRAAPYEAVPVPVPCPTGSCYR